jgi:hypothetical protein
MGVNNGDIEIGTDKGLDAGDVKAAAPAASVAATNTRVWERFGETMVRRRGLSKVRTMVVVKIK